MFDVHFGSLENKGGSSELRLRSVREHLMSAGSVPIDIYGLMCVMLDSVERLAPQPSTSSSGLSMEPPSCVVSSNLIGQ